MWRSFRVFPRINVLLLLILFSSFQIYDSFRHHLNTEATDDYVKSKSGGIYADAAGGDDHSSAHTPPAATHPKSLFGSFYFMEPKYWTVSLIIVVCAILMTEVLFHLVHILTEDSPFHKVVNALEKELMTVGVTAFIFKIVLNALNISEEWFFSLEIADLVVPLFSFTNCFISMILILRSLRHCDIWSKAYHLRAAELLDEYIESSWISLTYMKCIPIFSQLMQEIEFRIIHDIFCDHYNVQRKAFAFDEYVSLVYERFVLNIIELRLIHWVGFLVISFAYWIPTTADHALANCDLPHNISKKCAATEETYLITLFGALLVFVAVCFAMASRYYVKAIIRMAGVRSSDDYPQVMQEMDEAVDKQQVTESRRMDEEELKAVIKKAIHKAHNNNHTAGGHGSHGGGHSGRMVKAIKHFFASIEESITDLCRRSSGRVGHLGGNDNDQENAFTEAELKEMMNTSFKPKPEGTTALAAAGNNSRRKEGEEREKEQKVDNGNEEGQQEPGSPDMIGNRSRTLSNAENGQQQPPPPQSQSSSIPSSPNGNIKKKKKVEVPPLPMSSSTANDNSNKKTKQKNHSFHRDTDSEIKTIFLLQRPELYFEGVQFLLLPISLYFAVWFVEFSTLESTPLLKFLSFMPGVLSVGCYMTIVKSAALLKAIYHVDKDVMLEVIEQTEGSRQLGATIRSKLLHKLSLQAEDPFTTLRNLFAEIDANGSNQLSRLEFELLMDKLEVSFSRKKWKQIYHEIDRNYDDQISFDEFFIFLFPEHDLAKASEIKRLKKIRSRIAAKRAGGSKTNGGLGSSNKSSSSAGDREPSMLLIEDSERLQPQPSSPFK